MDAVARLRLRLLRCALLEELLLLLPSVAPMLLARALLRSGCRCGRCGWPGAGCVCACCGCAAPVWLDLFLRRRRRRRCPCDWPSLAAGLTPASGWGCVDSVVMRALPGTLLLDALLFHLPRPCCARLYHASERTHLRLGTAAGPQGNWPADRFAKCSPQCNMTLFVSSISPMSDLCGIFRFNVPGAFGGTISAPPVVKRVPVRMILAPAPSLPVPSSYSLTP